MTRQAELFAVDDGDGPVVAFLPAGGVFIYAEGEGRWRHEPRGSLRWDSLHQAVYRNHRADPLSLADLTARGIPLPPTEPPQGGKSIRWGDNFEAEAPLSSVPEPARTRLTRDAPCVVHLVLSEDTYETCQGDGRFIYPLAAFWTEEDSRAFIRLREAEASDAERRWIEYTTRGIVLEVDRAAGLVRAALGVETYEHYSIHDVIRLLCVS